MLFGCGGGDDDDDARKGQLSRLVGRPNSATGDMSDAWAATGRHACGDGAGGRANEPPKPLLELAGLCGRALSLACSLAATSECFADAASSSHSANKGGWPGWNWAHGFSDAAAGRLAEARACQRNATPGAPNGRTHNVVGSPTNGPRAGAAAGVRN